MAEEHSLASAVVTSTPLTFIHSSTVYMHNNSAAMLNRLAVVRKFAFHNEDSSAISTNLKCQTCHSVSSVN